MKKTLVLLLAFFILLSTMPQIEWVQAAQPGVVEGFLEEIIFAPNPAAQNQQNNKRGKNEVTPAPKKEAKQIKIETYGGNMRTLNVDRNMIRTIDSVPVEIEAFKPGMEVTAKVVNGKITHLEGQSTVHQAQVEFGKKVRTGVISQIQGNHVWLRLASGQVKEYLMYPNTPVFKKAQKADMSVLYEGDRVKFYFDDAQGSVISWLEIQGESVQIKDLYKAKLQKIDQVKNELLLQDVQVYKNANWKQHKPSMSIGYSADNPIYIGSQKLPREQLRLYRGSDVYLVTKEFFGKEKVEKMVIKDQYERTFSDKIDMTNVFVDELQLADQRRFSFHDGTIMIRNGRLVDKFAIQRPGDALIIADGRGGNQHLAHVIHVYDEGLSSPNLNTHQLYWGALDIIVDGSVWLKEFNVLNNHEWEFQFEDKLDLFYNNDTFIYDLTNDRQVDPTKVDQSNYAVDESQHTRDKKMKDWYGYLYVEDGRIVSLLLKKTPDDFLRHRTTTGRIESFVGTNGIRLKDAKDWIPRRQSWTPLQVQQTLNLRRAMLIKEGRPITFADLKVGDRLYMVRHAQTGIVVIVQ